MRGEVIHGDCLDVMRGMADASIDAVITDPPYSSGGMFRGDRATQSVQSKYVQTGSSNAYLLAPFSGDNRDQFGYWYWMALWLNEARRVVVPGGVCALFTDWRQLPTTACGIQAGGWVWRGIVPWAKPAARPTQGRWANSCEYVVWGTNGPRELAGAGLPGFFRASAPSGSQRQHITEKPVDVMKGLVAVVPEGGTVLDCFCGSGTTGVAAVETNRAFVGIECEAAFVKIARERIANATPPLFAEGAS